MKKEEKNKNNETKKTRKKNTKSSGKHVAPKGKQKNKNINNKPKKTSKDINTKKNDKAINNNEEKEKEKEKTTEDSIKDREIKQTLKANKENREKRREEQKHKDKIRKYILIACGSLLGVYVLGVIVFSLVCFPRTIVADTDLSFHDQNYMKGALEKNAGNYVFNAEGLGFQLNIEGNQINYNFNTDEVVKNVSEKKNAFAWPIEIFKVHDFLNESIVNFDKDKTTTITTQAIDEHNKVATQPQNANFVCDASTKTASIKEETYGNMLDKNKTLNAIIGYIGSGKNYLNVNQEHQLLPTLFADNDKIPAALEVADKILQSNITFVLSKTAIDTVDYAKLSTWLELKEGYVAGFNDQAVSLWSSNLANTYNTVGKPRTFVTAGGGTATVSGGDALGWAIDEAGLIDLLNKQAVKGVVSTEAVPCSSTWGDYNGPGAKDWPTKHIEVSLGAQTAVMVDESGSVVWSSPIVSGKKGEETPTGLYTIKNKKSPTILIGTPDSTGQPSYRSRVEYWMPFVGDMVGLHDAPWQPQFGGTWWEDHGSHGCVNLSTSAAGALYSICQSGDPVIVY